MANFRSLLNKGFYFSVILYFEEVPSRQTINSVIKRIVQCLPPDVEVLNHYDEEPIQSQNVLETPKLSG